MLAAALVLFGCGSEDETSGGGGGGDLACAAPARVADNGSCVAPGVQDSGCLAGELTLEDGTCQAAGIPADVVAAGFSPKDGGFDPILPGDPCGSGQMAVPGDIVCRPVMDCGSGPWGNLPVDGATVYVDQSHVGASSGSAAEPFTTIAEAITAASPGALVAVAAGSYAEELLIQGKPVRLWGVCPSDVEVSGGATSQGVITITDGAAGSEVGGLALTGPGHGFLVSGSMDLLIDQVWIHDTGSRGLEADDYFGPTSLVLRNSSIQRSSGMAIFAWDVDITVEDTMLHATSPGVDEAYGHAIVVADAASSNTRTALTLSGSWLVDNANYGLWALGADVDIERTVIGAPTPQADRGVNISADVTTGARANVSMRHTLVEGARGVGFFIQESDAFVEHSVIRGTRSLEVDGRFGRGMSIDASQETGGRSNVTLRFSVVEGNQEQGVMVVGGDALIEGLIVRDTLPQAADQGLGHGISVEDSIATGERGNLTLRGSLIERSHEVGIFVGGGDLDISGTLVRLSQPRLLDGKKGGGLGVQTNFFTGEAANASVSSSVFTDNFDTAVGVFAATANIYGCVSQNSKTLPPDDTFGDGVSFIDATGSLSFSLVQGSGRAGVSVFGAFAAVEGVAFECNLIDLAVDGQSTADSTITDLGQNVCGCSGDAFECKALAASLAPPAPLGSAL
jgi:hypothetical protein